MIRRYSELAKLGTYEERFKYLKLDSYVGDETFGFERYLNQHFYKLDKWKKTRDLVIVRDNGCDLGIPDLDISYGLTVHHMNPITKYDILNMNPDLFNPDFLICVSPETHRAIHYGKAKKEINPFNERTPNDTTPWRK